MKYILNGLLGFELFLSIDFGFVIGVPYSRRVFEVGADQTGVESFADINGDAQSEVPSYHVENTS